MKKLFLSFTVILCLFGSVAHADLFPPIGAPVQKAKLSEGVAIPGVDPGTILADVTRISGALGVREGYFYDVQAHQVTNYAAATIVTYAPWGMAVDFGALNADGVGASIDFNIGAAIPQQDVPLLQFFQYFYAGVGIGTRYVDQPDGSKGWDFSWGPTGSFKFTF